MTTEDPEKDFFVSMIEDPAPLLDFWRLQLSNWFLKLVATVDVYQQKIVMKFPPLFKGLGTLEGEYVFMFYK